jgi:hypothetical protein
VSVLGVSETFVCPRCQGALEDARGALSCGACGAAYPSLGGVPCLVDDPQLFRDLWRSRLDDYLRAGEAQLKSLAAERERPNLLAGTRRRLAHLSAAIEADRRAYAELFRDFAAGAGDAARALPRAPVSAVVAEYSENLFRDYVWGKSEAAATLELVRRLAPGALGKTAVYGVGTGQLALSIQQQLGAARTFGFDLNPLPLLVTSRLLNGDTVELHEFPPSPHSVAHTAVRQRLSLPTSKPDRLVLAFADALRPPLAPGSLDTVVTPWFIDAVSADIRETAAAVNRVLKPGGHWLNFGPLRFKGAIAQRYTIEEVEEAVSASAFELGLRFHEDVPYFHSPHSGAHRTERVFAFTATKSGDAPAVPSRPLFEPWLSDTREPIPALPSLAALQKSSAFTAGIVAMVDGRRSLTEIASSLSREWQVPTDALLAELKLFFARLPRE